MHTEAVSSSGLIEALKGVRCGNGADRLRVIAAVLSSGKFEVVRQIPDLVGAMAPSEIEAVYSWGGLVVAGDKKSNVSDSDSICYLMVRCGASTEKIMNFLRAWSKYPKGVLGDIEVAIKISPARHDDYLQQEAERLIKSNEIQARDRGRHILITMAKRSEDWLRLAERYAVKDFDDLRQRLLERFLEECPNEMAVTIFCYSVIRRCATLIAKADDFEKCTPQMHWMLSCAERSRAPVAGVSGLDDVIHFLQSHTGAKMPRSIREHIARDYNKSE